MKLKDFSVEDKCKFFDYMYKVAQEELQENGEEAPNHDLGYWLRDRILHLVTCASQQDYSAGFWHFQD